MWLHGSPIVWLHGCSIGCALEEIFAECKIFLKGNTVHHLMMQLPIVVIQSSIAELIVNLRFMQKPLTVYWKKVTKTEMDGFHGRNIYQKHETSIKFKRNKPRVRSRVGQLCTTYKWQRKTVIVGKTKSLVNTKRYQPVNSNCFALVLFGDYLHSASTSQSAYVIALTCIVIVARGNDNADLVHIKVIVGKFEETPLLMIYFEIRMKPILSSAFVGKPLF